MSPSGMSPSGRQPSGKSPSSRSPSGKSPSSRSPSGRSPSARPASTASPPRRVHLVRATPVGATPTRASPATSAPATRAAGETPGARSPKFSWQEGQKRLPLIGCVLLLIVLVASLILLYGGREPQSSRGIAVYFWRGHTRIKYKEAVESCPRHAVRCDGVADCKLKSDELGCVRFDWDKSLLRVYSASSHQWVPICSDSWNSSYSVKACQQLGFESAYRTGEVAYRGATSSFSISKYNSTLQESLYRSECPAQRYVSLQCSHCGLRAMTGRIVGGALAPESKWPWQVSLHYGTTHICGGTLIDSQWVLTAAHCFFVTREKILEGWKVYAGTNNLQQLPEAAAISQIIINGNYSDEQDDYDIALMRLSKPLALSAHIHPACLPMHGQTFSLNETCWITGFGKTRETDGGQRGSPGLRAERPLVPGRGHQLGDGLRPEEQARRVHQSDGAPALDIQQDGERGAPPEALSGLPTSPAAGGCEAGHAAPGSGHRALLRCSLPAAQRTCNVCVRVCVRVCVLGVVCMHVCTCGLCMHVLACACSPKIFRNQEGGQLFPNPRLDTWEPQCGAWRHPQVCPAEEKRREGPGRSHRELSPLWPRTRSRRQPGDTSTSGVVTVSSERPPSLAGGCSVGIASICPLPTHGAVCRAWPRRPG
ncbi:transmembrane protease serine 13 isoform X2 [Myotis lucifugus]|uniref:transmembrane protease serine 13 isoform X2 n=1 Tax=Myotis lucifugus TaxID=59463 RepID=UPI000CCBDA0B|nr:transmembrane protease serine 13 isoform X2 [Myotis lucifugus]